MITSKSPMQAEGSAQSQCLSQVSFCSIKQLTIIRRRRSEYWQIFTEPEANNYFGIILRCGHQKVKKKELKRDKQHTKNVT